VSRTLRALHRQHRTRDVHRPDQAHWQLAVELLGREFLELAGVEPGCIVDEHVGAAEPVNRGSTGPPSPEGSGILIQRSGR
jgi:hypothetical protein